MTMALFLIVFGVGGYLYFKHLDSGVSDTLTADERKAALADLAAKDMAATNELVDSLARLGLYVLAGFGFLLLVGVLCFIAWAWVGSGRAVKQAARKEAP
ncbi:hypothetical protein [Streptomyces flaveolus]|uniref:hypothetical protein n=1 Tax=Streptomyces flaveolus TaxID=67297 RepID=UPI0033FD97D1